MPLFRTLCLTALFSLSTFPGAAQELIVDAAAVRNLLTQWNEAHSSKNFEDLAPLYAEEVNFYGTVISRNNCLSKKRVMLKKHTDFSQTIGYDLGVTGYSSGVIRCDFVKTVYSNKKPAEYPTYLLLKEEHGTYMIVGESDRATDKRIGHEPELGTQVKIIEGTLEKPKTDLTRNVGNTGTIVIVVSGLVMGVIGLIVAVRAFKSKVKKTRSPEDKYYSMGLEFEKYVVAKIARDNRFKLLEWRSDKFHLGIFPESNRNPDLEYKYLEGNIARTFALECKYRSRMFAGSIELMNDGKFNIYEKFHLTQMPVYIVLGVGGGPQKPRELYLIPFKDIKPQMSATELIKYLKRGDFGYDIKRDRLF